jgi:hypothetical protein
VAGTCVIADDKMQKKAEQKMQFSDGAGKYMLGSFLCP